LSDPSGLLEWTQDDRIRLFELDRKDPQKSVLEFDITPQDLKKVTGISPHITFHLKNGKHYNFLFSDSSLFVLGSIGGLVGDAASDRIADKAGLKQWSDQLRQFGVEVKSTSRLRFMGKSALWVLAGTVAFMVIAVIVFLVAEY